MGDRLRCLGEVISSLLKSLPLLPHAHCPCAAFHCHELVTRCPGLSYLTASTLACPKGSLCAPGCQAPQNMGGAFAHVTEDPSEVGKVKLPTRVPGLQH